MNCQIASPIPQRHLLGLPPKQQDKRQWKHLPFKENHLYSYTKQHGRSPSRKFRSPTPPCRTEDNRSISKSKEPAGRPLRHYCRSHLLVLTLCKSLLPALFLPFTCMGTKMYKTLPVTILMVLSLRDSTRRRGTSVATDPNKREGCALLSLLPAPVSPLFFQRKWGAQKRCGLLRAKFPELLLGKTGPLFAFFVQNWLTTQTNTVTYL